MSSYPPTISKKYSRGIGPFGRNYYHSNAPADTDITLYNPPLNNNSNTGDPTIEQWKKNIKEPRWSAIYLNREGDAILYKIDLVTNQIFEQYIIKQASATKNCIQITMNDTSVRNIQVLGWIDDGTITTMTPAAIRAALNTNNLQALPKLIGINHYNEKGLDGKWHRKIAPIYLTDMKSVEPIECPRKEMIVSDVSTGGRKQTRHRLRSNRRKSKKVKRRY
jgi:hypothetical protein